MNKMGSVVTKCSTSSSNIQQPRHTSSDKPSYIGVNLDFLKAFAQKEKLQEKAVTGGKLEVPKSPPFPIHTHIHTKIYTQK
jgi:hypothetical protein